jgi:hypothetical protein
VTYAPADGKQQAHELIERLDSNQVSAVVTLLQFMLLDAASRALAAAPPDDEPETEGERRAVEEARAYFSRQGKGIPHDEILREFGL